MFKICRFILTAVFCGILFLWTGQVHADAPDTVIFLNGDQLTGKLISVVAGTVSFHSDILGDVTVPVAKVKSLHAARRFAIIEKNQHITRKTAGERVPIGSIDLEHDTIHLQSPQANEKSFPLSQISSLVDADLYHRELHNEVDPFYGWTGSITLGATLVTATNSAQTYTGAVALLRSIPTTAWLPPKSKTTLNLSATYGLAKDSEIVSGGNEFQAASVSKTDIKHGDAEYDRYFSQDIFGLINASADHNFGNGLQLQQSYGAGLGWSLLRAPKNSLDVKASLLYEQQQFYNGLTSGLGTPNVNLVGVALSENWAHTFAHGVKINQYVTLTPTFNVVKAYSGVANANFVFPVYKKLNFTLSSTDNYLGDPPQGFKRNSFQFTAGITYSLK
jgi:Protein of unknown function, DUF481